MDTPKRASWRRYVALAYAQGSKPRWQREHVSLPGPMFDIVVVVLFLVLAIGYYL